MAGVPVLLKVADILGQLNFTMAMKHSLIINNSQVAKTHLSEFSW